VYHVAMDIGETHVSAAEADSELFVVEAEQVKHRGVQVVHLDLVFHRVVAQLVGLAKVHPALDAASGIASPAHRRRSFSTRWSKNSLRKQSC
jgi:hypothetical protein